ncbi:MAG: hypothetical protein NTV44_06020, partial [Firmicutes bacterium]|nr:hypothetical protein [Bacillota bacterium]
MTNDLLHEFLFGQTIESYNYFGAHFQTIETTVKDKNGRKKITSEKGVMFRLYAPQAEDVSIIADW